MFPCEDSVTLDNLKDKFKQNDPSVLQTRLSKDQSKCVDSSNKKELSSDVALIDNSILNGISCDLKPTGMVISRKRCNEQTMQTRDQHELPSKHAKLSLKMPFEKVVLIDSTWNQTRNIANDERLKSELWKTYFCE